MASFYANRIQLVKNEIQESDNYKIYNAFLEKKTRIGSVRFSPNGEMMELYCGKYYLLGFDEPLNILPLYQQTFSDNKKITLKRVSAVIENFITNDSETPLRMD